MPPFDLAPLQKEIDARLAAFLDGKVAAAAAVSPLVEGLAGQARDFVTAGGKRLRPILFYYGYRAAGGQDREAALQASIAIELVHDFLLVQDDVIDKDVMRRHRPTLHYAYRQAYRSRFPRESAHIGNSAAILAGDLLVAYGQEVLAGSSFPSSHKEKAARALARIIEEVTFGQALDLFLSYEEADPDEQATLQVADLKTARYSFEGPLHLGALLGGGDPALLQTLSAYALPLGTAFQIKDDILGMFGDTKETGKSAASDIRQKKRTLLVHQTLAQASAEDRDRLRRIMEAKTVPAQAVRECRRIVRDSGALEYCQALAARKAEESARALEGLAVDGETASFLRFLLAYTVERER